jgi:hypothetical protein
VRGQRGGEPRRADAESRKGKGNAESAGGVSRVFCARRLGLMSGLPRLASALPATSFARVGPARVSTNE